jgi:hypothetical protein
VCIKKAFSENKLYTFTHGIDIASGILSFFGSKTAVHCEDLCLGSYNINYGPSSKVWYFVRECDKDKFLNFIVKTFGEESLELLFNKCLYLNLTAKQLAEESYIVRFVQPAGCVVVTMPGVVFHFTFSLGAGFAEAVNFFSEAGSKKLADIQKKWKEYTVFAKVDQGEHVAKTVEDRFKEFGLL